MERITMLGTGTALVSHYYNTCFVIARNEAEFILVDGGGGDGILGQFRKAGLAWQNLRHIIVTHEHTDHILGVVVSIRMIASLMDLEDYEGDCHLYCNGVVADKLQQICAMLLKKSERERIGKRIIFHVVADGETQSVMAYPVQFFDTGSTKSLQYGFKLQLDNGRSLVCLGDEPYHDSAYHYVKDADWLLCEAFCLYAERDIYTPYQYHHSTVKEASELAQSLNVQNLVLYHTEEGTYPNRKKRYSQESWAYFGGRVYVPDDLESIEL